MRTTRTARPRARVAAGLAGGMALISALATGCGGATPGPVQATVEEGGRIAGGPAAAQIARFRWSVRPGSPLGAHSAPVLAWTGRELIELGGLVHGASSYAGAAFDPATDRWRRIAPLGSRNVGLTNAVSAWTGRQLFVSNGQSELCVPPRAGSGTAAGGGTAANCWPQAGLYDPATNQWSLTRLPGLMDGLQLAAAVWTGRDVIVAGVNANRGRLGVASFDPATGRWQMITPALPSGHPPQAVEMVATPGGVILWSPWFRYHGNPRYGVDVLALGTDSRWRDVTGPWPQQEDVTSPVYTGAGVLVSPGQIWCGLCNHPYSWNPGYFADPVTLARKPIPLGPLGMANPTFVWAGRAIIAVNLDASIGGHGRQAAIRPDDMALWDPAPGDMAANRWLGLPAPPGYPRLAAPPVWTGTGLLALTTSGQLLAWHG